MPSISLLKNQVSQARVVEIVKCHARRALEFRAAFYLALGEEDLEVYLEEMPKVFLEAKRLLDAGGAAASLEAVMAGVLGSASRVKMAEGVQGRIARWRSGVTGTRGAARVTESGVAESGVSNSGISESRVAEPVAHPVADSLIGGLSRLPAPTGAVMGSVVARAVEVVVPVISESRGDASGKSEARGSGAGAGQGQALRDKAKAKGSLFTVEAGAVRAQAAKPVGVKPLEVTEVAAAHALVAGASEGDLVASGSSGELRVTGDGAREVGRGNLGSKFENLLARFEAQALTLETQSGELLELRGQVKAQDLKLEELSAALGVLSPDADLARAGVRELMELRESVRVDSAELQSARAEVCALHHEVLESRDVVVAQRIRLVNVEDFQLAILEVFYSVSVGWETLVEESRLLRLCVARVENRVDQAFALAASSRLWIKNEAVKVLREAGFKVRHPNEWTTASPAESKRRRREAVALGVKPTTLVHSNQRVMMPKILAADESIELSVVNLPLPRLDSVDGVSSDELRARENIALRHLRLAHLGSVVMTYAEAKFSKSDLARAVELQLEVARRVVSERALYLTAGHVTGTELGWALDGQALVAEGVMPPGETVEFRLKKQEEFEKLRAILLKPGPLLPGADPGVASAGVHLDPVWVAELLASPDAVDARLEGSGDAVFGSGDAVVTQVHGVVTLEGGVVTGGAVQRTVGTAVLEGDVGSPELVTEPLEAGVVEAESLETESLETESLETESLETESLETESLETADLDDENMEVKDSEIEDSEIELPRIAALEGDQLEDNVEFPPIEMFDEDVAAGRQVLNESRVDSGRGDSGRGKSGRVISTEDDEINAW